MGRILISMLLSLFIIGSSAQDKLFQEGLSKGRARKHFYYARNNKGKGLSLDNMKKYANSHDYLIGHYTTKEIERFGDKDTAIDAFFFLPKKDYPSFVFECAIGNKTINLSDLSKTGSCWLFINGNFCKYDMKWSGSVIDGKLDGEGIGFFISEDEKTYLVTSGKFQNGMPLGSFQVEKYWYNRNNPEKVSFSNISSVKVNKLQEGLASFTTEGGKWGFVSQDGEIAVKPIYASVIKEFTNGRAEVLSEGREIVIGKTGNYIGLTDNQKRIEAQQKAKEEQERLRAEQERKQKEIADKQRRIEQERLKAEAEKRRLAKFRSAMPGDKVYYSQEWTHTDNWIFWSDKTKYTMRVVCFVEQNVNNGERLQIRVAHVESSNSRHYSTPKIDGVELRKGDVLWIKPLNDHSWQIE